MKILLMAATEYEVKPASTKLKNNFFDARPDILIGGIGIPSTIFHLTKSLLQNKYDLVIQAGIGGTFTNELYLGEVVLINADTFGDTGIEENGIFTNLFTSGLADKNAFPFKDGWLINTHDLPDNPSLKTVKGITINKITDDKTRIDQQKVMYNVQVESMEGAALHYVCLQLNIHFLQMRGISNVVGDRNKATWKMKEAIENLNSELLNTLSALYNIH